MCATRSGNQTELQREESLSLKETLAEILGRVKQQGTEQIDGRTFMLYDTYGFL